MATENELKAQIQCLQEACRTKNEQIAILRLALDERVHANKKYKVAIEESVSLMEDVEDLKKEVILLKAELKSLKQE